MKKTKEYKVWLKDQQEDGNTIGNKMGRINRKKWMYAYMNLLCDKCKDHIDFHNAKILDVGCKELYTFDYFQEKYNNTNVTGVDIVLDVFECEETKNKPIQKIDAHFLADHFSPGTFDIIIVSHSLEHMFDLSLVAQNLYTILKDDGILFSVVPIPSKNEKKGHWQELPNTRTFVEKMNIFKVQHEFDKHVRNTFDKIIIFEKDKQ